MHGHLEARTRSRDTGRKTRHRSLGCTGIYCCVIIYLTVNKCTVCIEESSVWVLFPHIPMVCQCSHDRSLCTSSITMICNVSSACFPRCQSQYQHHFSSPIIFSPTFFEPISLLFPSFKSLLSIILPFRPSFVKPTSSPSPPQPGLYSSLNLYLHHHQHLNS